MPTGPRGERRPADVIGAAIMIAEFATGEIAEHSKSGRIRSGKAGAKAHAECLSTSRRKEIARKAAAGRWENE